MIGSKATIHRAEVHDKVDVVLLIHGELLDSRVLQGKNALDVRYRGFLHPEYADFAIAR